MTALLFWKSYVVESFKTTPLRNLILLSLLFSALFIRMPTVDIEFSRMFFVDGQGFAAREVRSLQTLRAIGQYVPTAFAILVILALILKIVYPRRRCLFPARFTLYFSSLFLLGPCLLVNGILKPLWDRPRPINILEFGGQFTFVDAWSLGGDILVNRSFVSGETAGVICLLPLALFVRAEWRKSIFALLSVFAVVVSMNRIAFGGHFLSDVLISAALNGAIAVALWYAIYGPQAHYSDASLERQLSRMGFSLRRSLAKLPAKLQKAIPNRMV